MKMWLIDPGQRTITDVDLDPNTQWDELYHVLGCAMIEVATPFTGVAILTNEEGLLDIDPDTELMFCLTLGDGSFKTQPYAGRTLLCGVDNAGEFFPLPATLDDATRMVEWLDPIGREAYTQLTTPQITIL